MPEKTRLERVDYDVLDRAKTAFIEASRKTMRFADRWGFVPEERLGASANVFALDLKSFMSVGADRLFITLLPEGLGTADDARPDDLSSEELSGFWRNIGIKTVSCLTNDAASSGMQTILISLYLPSSNPEFVFDEPFLTGFLGGFVAGCAKVGCVYISGETPQLKGKICENKLDIAGALFGLMPAGVPPIDGSKLAPGNKIVLVASSGPHENGFTTLRRVARDLPQGYRTKLPNGQEFWQAINAPSMLYTPLVQRLLAESVEITGIENITGHGWQKIMRSKKPLCYLIEKMLPVLPVFQFIEESTNSSKLDMLKIFNYGVGSAIYVANQDDADKAVEIAAALGFNATVAGKILEADRREVLIEPLALSLSDNNFALTRD
jgi:phosphoribosylformylglycinamidine cyclo-ligase